MKITGIDTFVVDAGWRPWQFIAVRTDEGITGYGECSDGRNPYGVTGAVTDLEPVLIGEDPLAVERRYWDMYRLARQSPGGIAAKAIAGAVAMLGCVDRIAADRALKRAGERAPISGPRIS